MPLGSRGRASAARKPRFECHGVDRGDIRGVDPTYTRKSLADFRNHKRLCGGLWLPDAAPLLRAAGPGDHGQHRLAQRLPLPQGVRRATLPAASDQPAHRQAAGLPRRDLRPGRPAAAHLLPPRRGHPPARLYLWIVEKNKLWQVDPSSGSNVLNARRVWRIKAPARGSAIVATEEAHRPGAVRDARSAAIYWFTLQAAASSPASSTSARRARGASQVGAVATHPGAPPYVQGATLDRRGRPLPGALRPRLRWSW